ncbi:hypothetical protein [Oscillibacter sp.]|uniref:hypothetical protein n=1 Tax=Oscillibacter sp. TaxID=1945593 RepID=UPI002D7EE615|nr:hypothetical protein [Oscillibacter sp.]
MKRSVIGVIALASALCLLLAACGGQGASPSGAPPPEQPSKTDGTVPPAKPNPVPEEKTSGKEGVPDKSEAPQPEEEPPASGGEEIPAPLKGPRDEALAGDIAPALEGLEETNWQIVSISAKDYGIIESPIGDPAIYGGAASLSLGKLTAVSLASDGAAAEDLFDELWRRFLEEPDAVLAFLALIGDQQDRSGESAAEVICGHIATADAAWYNSIEFSEILSDRRVRYSTGRIGSLLDVLDREHAAGLRRNGWQGVEPSPAPPREPPSEGWEAVSIRLEDYGLTRTLSDPRFEYIFNHTDTVPLDQLIVFTLWGDALTEGSAEELRSRFLEAPDTVLAFLVLMGDQRVDYWDQPPAAEVVCRHIAVADAAWHDGTEEFAAALAACRERHPGGREAELLDVLEREHAASMERNHGQQ